MDILIAYSKQFAECNDSFYNTRENLKRIYGNAYIKNLEHIQRYFSTKFYDIYSISLISVADNKLNQITKDNIKNLLIQYKFVINELQQIYEFYMKHTTPQTLNTKTR